MMSGRTLEEVNCPTSPDKSKISTTMATNPNSYRQLFGRLLHLTYPLVACEMFQSLLPVVDIAFVGHLSKDDLAVAAIATTWFNFINITMFGLMTAIDTFLAQTYGARQFISYGIWTGNSMVIIFCSTIVASGAMSLCGPFMYLISSDPALAKGAGMYALRLIPGLFPYFMFKVLCKYLQTQHILGPSMWIGLMANGMNVLFNWALIYRADLGVVGSPWATSLTRALEAVMICAYIITKRNSLLKQTWPVVSCRNLSSEQLYPFMHIGLPGALAFLARGGFFEATTLASSFLGSVSLGAHAIALSMNTFLFVSFPFAIGNAASILVGSAIGEGKPCEAKRSSRVSLVLSYIVQLTVVSVLLLLRNELAGLFSSDQDVAGVFSNLIPVMCVFLMFDASVATAGGIFRGLGKQKWIMRINLFGSWILAMPAAFCLAFKTSLSIYGLWWGMSIGVVFSASACQYILNYSVDWERECIEAAHTLSSVSFNESNRRASCEPLLPEDAAEHSHNASVS